VNVVLNGQPRTFDDAMTLAALVERLGLDRDVIAVELNRGVVRRGTYAGVVLRPGDEIEIVTLVGGG
jgi:thiamine biosynthesis protein ThiS